MAEELEVKAPPVEGTPEAKKEEAPPAQPTIEEAVNKALQPILAKIESMAKPPLENAAPGVSDIDKEISLREQQLAAIRSGALDARYEPEVMSKLSAAQAQKVGREIVGQETGKNQYFAEWNAALQQAYAEFPELKDQTSELFKEAKALVEQDPGYRRYLQVVNSKGGEKFDFSALDPRVNLRAAREAFAIVTKRNEGKPKTPTNRVKTVLEGGSSDTPAPTKDELDSLEKKAAESGDPGDWRRLIKARDNAQKTRERAMVV